MESEQKHLHQHGTDEQTLIKEYDANALRPISFLPFDVQLQNTFCIEIAARRFPVASENMPHVQVNLEDTEVDAEHSLAQVTLHIWTISDDDQPLFDIAFKLLGIFTYTEGYSEDEVRLFLKQGSLSILLPFARELLINICTRLQVPPMMLTMVKLTPNPSLNKTPQRESFQND